MRRTDRSQLQLVLLTSTAEPCDRLHVGGTRVLVTDGGGEEFEEVFTGLFAGVGDDDRNREGTRGGGQERRGNEISGHGAALFHGMEFQFRHREVLLVVGNEREPVMQSCGRDQRVGYGVPSIGDFQRTRATHQPTTTITPITSFMGCNPIGSKSFAFINE